MISENLWQWFYRYDDNDFANVMKMYSQDIMRMILLIWWRWFYRYDDNALTDIVRMILQDIMRMILLIWWQWL